MSEKVTELVKEINTNLSQVGSSNKDEVRVMRAMLSDDSYVVDVYGRNGVESTFSPANEFRSMAASIISNAAKIPQAEAAKLMADYEVRKSEASAMVGISKEFVNTYLHTGRKLPLGGRAKSDVSLSLKQTAQSTRQYPLKVGVGEDGQPIYSKAPTTVAAHEGIRVHAPCPPWVKVGE